MDRQLIEKAAKSTAYAQQLADLTEQKGLLKAPANLKSSILEQSRHMDVQMIAKSNLLSRKLELFWYGLKVGAAVVCSVAFIVTVPTSSSSSSGYRIPTHRETSQKVRQVKEQLEQTMRQFSIQLWNVEVSTDDK